VGVIQTRSLKCFARITRFARDPEVGVIQTKSLKRFARITRFARDPEVGVIQREKGHCLRQFGFCFHNPYRNKFLTDYKKQKARTIVLTFLSLSG